MASKKITLTNQEVECLKFIIPRVLNDYYSDIDSINDFEDKVEAMSDRNNLTNILKKL